MKTTFTVTLSDGAVQLTLPSGACVHIITCNHDRFDLADEAFFLLTKKGQIKQIGTATAQIGKLEFDHVLIVTCDAYDLEASQLAQYLTQRAEEGGIKFDVKLEHVKLPKNIYNACAKASDEFLTALEPFGYTLTKKKFVSPKAQHRWKKAISEIPFEVQHVGTSGTVIWQKATEMRLLTGAKLLPDTDAPRRKDGTLGFTAKFAMNLRAENAAKIDKKTWTTTDDIILRSVNEVGHFLYFAGTNSWLEMFDASGRTIHELTVV